MRNNDYSNLGLELIKITKNTYIKTVSIIIPFYNGFTLLHSLLNSLSNQTYPKDLMEIIVVDDGSRHLLNERFLQKLIDVKSRLITLEKRTGYRISTVRNIGIEHAKGEVIICLDQDIICPPWFVEAHLRCFHISNTIATFGLRRFVDTSNIPLWNRNYEICSKLPEIPSSSNRFKLGDKRLFEIKFIKRHPFPFNCFHGCNIAFTKEKAISVGLFDENFDGNFGYEDLEFGYRLWSSGDFILFLPNAIVVHQENNILSIKYKNFHTSVNLHRLYNKIPGLKEYREKLKTVSTLDKFRSEIGLNYF